jgi:hypothetical protein
MDRLRCGLRGSSRKRDQPNILGATQIFMAGKLDARKLDE